MLESYMHTDSSFATLTYTDKKLPLTSQGLPTLVPKHSQDWLKRLRKETSPLRIRYYLCGEYGDINLRPHFHVILFGYPKCSMGRTHYRRDGETITCCDHCRLIASTWTHGRIDLIELSTATAQYCSGYVTKKLTRTDDPRLNGRWPEFARMSNRPGIGKDAMWEIASTLMKFNLEDTQADVPSALRHGSRLLPLGRYLRKQLRLMTGKEDTTPDQIKSDIFEKMRPLLEAARASTENPSVKNHLLKSTEGKRSSLKALDNIYKQKRTY